jgi:hypothetical protein
LLIVQGTHPSRWAAALRVSPASSSSQKSPCLSPVNFAGRPRFVMPECPWKGCGSRDPRPRRQHGLRRHRLQTRDARLFYRPTWHDFETPSRRFREFTNDGNQDCDGAWCRYGNYATVRLGAVFSEHISSQQAIRDVEIGMGCKDPLSAKPLPQPNLFVRAGW